MTPGVPGVRVEAVAGPVTVRVVRGALARTAEQEAALEDAWRAMCARNPRYFNGRILSFESYDAGSGVAIARDVAYRDHAARDAANLGIAFFGVTGILRVGAGAEARCMVGRRGATVHDYPGQWEFGPCGGIDPPAPPADTLTPEDIAREVGREASEELGIDLGRATTEALALVHDDPVGSTDLMLLVSLDREPATNANWEYSAVRWLTLPELAAWGRSRPDEVIPTTRAVCDWMLARGL